jgi:hypothetical protein
MVAEINEALEVLRAPAGMQVSGGGDPQPGMSGPAQMMDWPFSFQFTQYAFSNESLAGSMVKIIS